ncbi:RNA polymerase sigma factor [Rhizobium alvei]|uniref:Sigma-70 family RNA polymerase sigma factor n=1 Tax=Rhizobium alvei TaxID=1132659 RepID=A0ABT8YIZ9_9HYPH|nr:sigma-70 family RNA polymerase sigma factor [Rhizobium alvei]MDO6963308.1 sigma-70 family RNA polymerase sigma factor [Rhizobium alvei]
MEADLIRRAKAGERQAFADLLTANYDFIHAVAWKWTRNRIEADDIAQDVCLKIATALQGFRGDGQFRGWLYRMTLNAVRDRSRQAKRERSGQDAWISDPSQMPVVQDRAELDALWTAVQSLGSKQRDAVMLVYSEGLSHAEAAHVLGCTESTVSWHLHEARKRLKILLGRDVA